MSRQPGFCAGARPPFAPPIPGGVQKFVAFDLRLQGEGARRPRSVCRNNHAPQRNGISVLPPEGKGAKWNFLGNMNGEILNEDD